MQNQPWINSRNFDLLFILVPSFFAVALLTCFPESWLWSNEMPSWTWFVLVLMIDVSHVYSSLYRTYFDKIALQKHRNLLIFTPLWVGLLAGGIHFFSTTFFWTLAAYLAVFHFIRQQYGFLKLYTRAEGVKQQDIFMVYDVTIFPILHWHLSPPRNFTWFTVEDFFFIENQVLANYLKYVYWLGVFVYYSLEIKAFIKTKYLNLPKTLLIFSTMLTWYLGIVHFNGDVAFTMLNVVAHGVPYMALVYASEQKKPHKTQGLWRLLFSNYGIVFFLGILFAFAYIEEGFWNGLVWHEYDELFMLFPSINLTSNIMTSIVVALLSLPQLTHYVLDGYIWKREF
jgi:hypothetical protein